MKRVLWFLLAAYVFLATPTLAAWTTPELSSLGQLRLALDKGLMVIEASCGGPVNATACRDLSQGLYEISQTIGWLFHVNVNPNDKDGTALLAPYLACYATGQLEMCGDERAPVVQMAWKDLDRAHVELNKATTFAQTLAFQQMLQALAAVDRSLLYAAPLPATYPKQFGPHGNYPVAQQQLWSMMQYGNSALKAWLQGVQKGTLPACPGMAQNYARALQRGLVDTWFLSAHVVTPNATYAGFQTPFVQALPDTSSAKRAFTELQLVNGPVDGGTKPAAYNLRFMGSAAGVCLLPKQPHLGEWLLRYTDQWANMDLWTGEFTAISETP